jgi:hypothetical protein
VKGLSRVRDSPTDLRAIPNNKSGVPIITVSGRWRFASNCFRPHTSEIPMKTILSAAMVLGLCGLAGARDEKANPVGTYFRRGQTQGERRGGVRWREADVGH